MIIIAKNQTAGDLPLKQLAAPDAKIPASGQVTLTDWNSVHEIQDDPELVGYIQGDQVLLNDGNGDLNKQKSLNYSSQIATTNNPQIDIGMPGSIQPNDSAAEGSAPSLIRSDHTHGIVTDAPSQGIGGGNAEGVATDFSRADHDHTLRTTTGPTDLTVGTIGDGETVRRVGTALVGYTPVGGSGTFDKDEFTPTLGQVSFILSRAPTDDESVVVTINGIETDDVTDWTVSGTTLTWLDTEYSLDSNDKLIVRYM